MKAVTSTGCTCYVSISQTAEAVRRNHVTTDDSLTAVKATLVKRVDNLARLQLTWKASAFTLRDKAGKVINMFPASSQSALLDVEYKTGSWFVYWYGGNRKL